MTFVPGLELTVAALRAKFVANNPSLDHRPESGTLASAIEICVRNKTLLAVREPLSLLSGKDNIAYINQYKMQTFILNTIIVREIASLSKYLSERFENFIVIKGPVQQSLIYRDFNFRPVSDIDILVMGHEYDRYISALADRGYSGSPGSFWWRAFLGEQHLEKAGPPQITVDLHYRIQQPGSPAPRSTASYFENRQYTEVLGVQVPRLARRDIPLLSAISIVKGLFNRECVGAHVCDLYSCVKADAPQTLNDLLTIAGEQNLRGTVLLALRVVAHTFGVTYHLDGEINAVLKSVPGDTLVRMAFTPDDPALEWPKRREVLWALCLQQPLSYAKEVGRALGSEMARRLFERNTDTVG